MLLKVPMRKQKKGSVHCCIVCLQMIMEYFGDKASFNELLNQIKLYRKGTWLADGGKVALKYGYKAFFSHHDSDVLTKETENLTEKDLAKLEKHLKNIKNGKYKKPRIKAREIRKDIEFIKIGGKYSTKVPTLNLIDSYLKRKIPVIVVVKNKSWKGEPDNKSSHCIVLVGKEGNHYIVNNPLPQYKKLYKVEKNKLLHAWYWSGCYTLAVYK